MTAASRSLTVMLLAALCGSVSAQPVDVSAEALFREGRRLLKEGKIPEACEKLDASARLDESVGTLLNLGDCREKNDQLATAWATFLKAASAARAKHDDRETVARQRASALEPRLSLLTISVPEASRVDGLVIRRNDTQVDAALWNQGVPVDAGNYEIAGEAPGHEPWSTKVQIRGDGLKQSVEVPRFKQLKDLVAPAPKPATEPEPTHDSEVDAPTPARFTTLRKVSIGSAALGVIGIAGGIRYGLLAKDLDRQSNAICPGTVCGDAHARALNQSAQRDALASEVMFGVGGAAVAGAVVLWVVGAPATVTPIVGGGETGVVVAGRF
jgi:hypothetical protein